MIPSWIVSLVTPVFEQLRRLLRPHSSSALEFVLPPTDMDDDFNKRSAPPPEEHIDLMCIWGIEFYTPSLVDRLEKNLHELHRSNVSTFRSSHHPVHWLRSLRRFRYSGGWTPLGPFAPQNESQADGPQRLPLTPPHVSAVHGHIASLSPSLIAVSMCFVLDESLSAVANASLRENRTSTWEPIENGKGLQDPRSQKQRDFDRIRLELQGGVHEWFEMHLPGVFTVGKAEVPTCQLITAKVARPYRQGDEKAPDWFSYQRIVGFEKGMDSWHLKDADGFVFDVPDNSSHSVFVANESDLPAFANRDQDRTRYETVAHANLSLSSMLRVWAMLPLMEHFTREVATSSVPFDEGPEHTLDVLKRGMVSSIDVAALSNELADEAREKGWLYEDASQFVRDSTFGDVDDDETLAKLLSYRIRNQAVWLREADRAARENALQYGTLLAAAENIRLQRSLKWFTIALFVLGLASIAVTLVAALLL